MLPQSRALNQLNFNVKTLLETTFKEDDGGRFV